MRGSGSAPPPPTGDVSFSRVAFAGATAIFLVFGAIAAIYGPLLVQFSHHFGVSLPEAAAVLSVHFLGALFGVPITWTALRRYEGHIVLAGTLLAMAIGALGAALAHSFAELLAAVMVIGLGFGGTDYSLNSFLLRSDEQGRAHRLSVANGGYGVGAVVGPLLVIVARPGRYPLVFVALGLGALALVSCVKGIRAPTTSRLHPHLRHPRRRVVLGLFVAAYVLYVATETSAAGWIAPHLHRIGYSESVGALTTAGFWLGLALGRFLAGPVHRRVGERQIVFCGLACAAVVILATSVDAIAPALYVVGGFSLALVYPMGLMWFTRLSPGDSDGLAVLMFTMMAGGVVGPALTGAGVALLGVHAVPVCIALFAAADLATFALAAHVTGERGHPAGVASAVAMTEEE